MLFMCHGKPKPGLTTEDRRQVLKLFAGWQPPAALQIKGHWIAADGSDYVVVETDSVACLIEATGIWAPYVDYVVTPITEVSDAIGGFARAEDLRSTIL